MKLSPDQKLDIAELRAVYQQKFGKRPYMGWGEDVLRGKLLEQPEAE